jgi:hypothetical protein
VDIGERLNSAAGGERVSDGRRERERERQASSRWPRLRAFLLFISSSGRGGWTVGGIIFVGGQPVPKLLPTSLLFLSKFLFPI